MSEFNRVGGCARFTQIDVVKEVRPQKQQKENCCVPCCANMKGSENSCSFCTVKSCRCWTAHVGEQGLSCEGSGPCRTRTGLNCYMYESHFLDRTAGFLGSSYSLSHFTNLLHALFRRPASKSWGLKVTACLITFN